MTTQKKSFRNLITASVCGGDPERLKFPRFSTKRAPPLCSFGQAKNSRLLKRPGRKSHIATMKLQLTPQMVATSASWQAMATSALIKTIPEAFEGAGAACYMHMGDKAGQIWPMVQGL